MHKSLFESVRGAVREVLVPPAAVGCPRAFSCWLMVPEVSMAPWRTFPAARQDAQLEGDLFGVSLGCLTEIAWSCQQGRGSHVVPRFGPHLKS